MSECKSCQRYEDCSSGDGITQPCGAYVPRAKPLEKIITYPQMNEIIKDLLRRSAEPMNLYILARIEELEHANAEMLEAWRDVCEACGFNGGCEYRYCASHKWRSLWKRDGEAQE